MRFCKLTFFLLRLTKNYVFLLQESANDKEDSDIDDLDCLDVWQDNYKEHSSQIQSRDASGKFKVTFAILDSLMNNTKEKIILVSYSTKV